MAELCRVVQVLLVLPRFEHDIGHLFAQLARESRNASAGPFDLIAVVAAESTA